MVQGADTMLAIVSCNTDECFLKLTDQLFDSTKVLIIEHARIQHHGGGGDYILETYQTTVRCHLPKTMSYIKHNQYSNEQLRVAHIGSSSHKAELSNSHCGCFYCEATFNSSEINDWLLEPNGTDETALCPRCGIDAVLSSKYPIDDIHFLNEMHKFWFG